MIGVAKSSDPCAVLTRKLNYNSRLHVFSNAKDFLAWNIATKYDGLTLTNCKKLYMYL